MKQLRAHLDDLFVIKDMHDLSKQRLITFADVAKHPTSGDLIPTETSLTASIEFLS